jgi:RNA polymerase sigma-70 factor (ECF subfamily)
MKETPEATDVNMEKDRILIRQVKQGYKSAFTELVTLHQGNVFKLAYGFFQDRDDAMEIVQETFLRLFQKLDGFDENDPGSIFHKWVYRIAYNLCIDFYRKFKKQKADMREIYEFDEEMRPNPASPEEQMDRRNFRRNLKKSVMRLPRRQKMVFVLKHYSGLKHHEISEMLDLSVGTIKSLYHRSIQSIKKSLAGQWLPDSREMNGVTG